ncbi:MAG: YHS domain-containing protein [Ignavibacteriota bacterium]|nr:YHS domain-containing protein [Ignavibacteriales bacterium]MBL1121851.1 YHS domain-containing protein [Ignavibacteriota bacterium]NUM63607.1 YHS domain-containing protein [Ignavibacteriaceae bacterium]QKJ97983.1 MAG: YHS domain-containing protein [Ignavibacteriota bacterium]
MEKTDETEVVQIWNKFCPVKGEEVDADVPTFEYQGKVIGFCCPGCDKKFQKDPETYLKNLNEDGSEFIGS